MPKELEQGESHFYALAGDLLRAVNELPHRLIDGRYYDPIKDSYLESVPGWTFEDEILSKEFFDGDKTEPFFLMLSDIIAKHGSGPVISTLRNYSDSLNAHAKAPISALVSWMRGFGRELDSLGVDSKSVLLKGQLGGIDIAEGRSYIPRRSLFGSDLREIIEIRSLIAKICEVDPELARLIVDNKIVAAHGTTSMALPSILAHGLIPVEEQNLVGIGGITGEKWGNVFGDFAEGVSCVTLEEIGTALTYSTGIGPITSENIDEKIAILNEQYAGNEWLKDRYEERKDYFKRLKNLAATDITDLERDNFGVTILIPAQDLMDPGETEWSRERVVLTGDGLPGEFLLKDGASLGNGAILLVPNDRVEEVRRIVPSDKNVLVHDREILSQIL